MEEERLTKKEKRALAKEEKKKEREGRERSKKLKNWIIGLLVLIGLFGVAFWLYRAATKPLQGQVVADLGAEHVNDISGITYNSNPPTSGPHFPVWAKPGFYDQVISDGHLIHSLEHGYIVISYNCEKKVSRVPLVPRAFANGHEDEIIQDTEATQSTETTEPLTRMRVGLEGAMSAFTPDNKPPSEVELPDAFKSSECDALVQELTEFLSYRKRVIVVPRTNLDSRIALTAWRRTDKMDQVDEERIKDFISSFHNAGPEQTVE